MTDFDPYLKWLGIRDPQRPVNHYRLLGLDLFESDADVIATAADRQMAHVRTYQSGARAELSQQILSELAVARRCLLMPEQKEAYDNELRQSIETVNPVLQAAPAASVDAPFANPTAPAAVVTPNPDLIAVTADTSLREKRKKREKNQLLIGMVGWIGGGLAAVAVCAALIHFGIIPGFGTKDPKIAGLEPKNDGPPTTNNNTRPNRNQSNRKSPDNNSNTQKPGGNDRTNPPDRNVIDDPRHPDFVWTRNNLNRYPAPNPSTQNLLKLIGDAVAGEKVHQLGLSSSDNQSAEYQLLSGNHLLVGLTLSLARDGSIKTLAPLQQGPRGVRAGQEYGRNRTPSRIYMLAKPGYAVGAIEVSTERPMKCIRLIYMKILDDRLDTKDQYASEWYPNQIRPITRIRNSVGLPIVGTYGRYRRSSHIETLGLIGALTHDALGIVSINQPFEKGTDPFQPDNNPDVTTEANAKMDPPSLSEIESAREEILTLYERQFREATVNETRANRNEIARRSEILRARKKAKDLANMLIQDATREEKASPTQFSLYREAASIGSRIGDLEIVNSAMREIDLRYQIDFWKLMDDAVKDTEVNALESESFSFQAALDDLIDQAMKDKKFKEADGLVDWAYNKVKKSDSQQADKYKELGKKIGSLKKAQVANERAWKILKDEPDNSEANQDIGMFEFLVNEDTEAALEYWAKAENKELLELAELTEATDFESASSIVTLADAWRKIGKSNRTFQDKMFLEHARDHLQSAVPHAEGLEQRRIQKMIEDLQEEIDK